MISTVGWTWQGPGEPGDLVRDSFEVPEPGDLEVCVENRLVAFNPVDWKLIEGGHAAWSSGQVPGVDGMGTVVAKGSRVDGLDIGQRVAYHSDLRRNGSFAQHTVIEARTALKVPDSVSDMTAAAFPCPGMTAWLVSQKLPDLSNQAVMVAGAGSNVGGFVVPLLRDRGARIYCSADVSHHAALLSSGVEAVADYHDGDWIEQLLESNNGAPFQVAIDLVSSDQAVSLQRWVGYSGHLVSVLGRVERHYWPPFGRCLSFHEVALGAMHEHGTDQQWARMIKDGEQMLTVSGAEKTLLPAMVIGDFEELPDFLKEYKNKGQGKKYLVKV